MLCMLFCFFVVMTFFFFFFFFFQAEDGIRDADVTGVQTCALPIYILLLPDAAVDDKVFDVVALRPKGIIGWLQIWLKIVWENGVLRRTVVGRKIGRASCRERV